MAPWLFVVTTLTVVLNCCGAHPFEVSVASFGTGSLENGGCWIEYITSSKTWLRNAISWTQKFMGTEVEGVSLYTGNFLTMVDVGSKTASSKLLRQQLGFFICGWFCCCCCFFWPGLALPCFTRCLLKFWLVKALPYLPPPCQSWQHTASVTCFWLLKVKWEADLKKTR